MARTAPVPNIPAIPGMNPGLFVLGGGGDGGGSGGGDGDGKGGKQGANGKNGGKDANGGGKNGKDCGAGSGAGCPNPSHGGGGGTQAGHPIDPVTGRVYTISVADMVLPGTFPLLIERAYSSDRCDSEEGLGYGWSHSLARRVMEKRRRVRITTESTLACEAPLPEKGATVKTPLGELTRTESGYFLQGEDGLTHVFEDYHEADSAYRLTAIVDRNGNRARLFYEGVGGPLAFVNDSVGRLLRVRRNRDGRIAAFEVKNESEGGAFTSFRTYEYDMEGNLTAARDAMGHAVLFAYDEDHRLLSERWPTGFEVHYRYDRVGRCVETWCTDPREKELIDASAPAVLADGRKALGFLHHRVEYGATECNVVTSRAVRRVQGNAFGTADRIVWGGQVHDNEFDAGGQHCGYKDGLGRTWRWGIADRLFRVQNPLGHTTEFGYDRAGNVVTTRAADGAESLHERDGRGNLLALSDALGLVARLKYDARGLVVEGETADGGKTTMKYDALANRIEIVEPDGATRRLRYDFLGRLTEMQDAKGGVHRFRYDAMGRQVEYVSPLGSITRTSYDEVGRVTGQADADGRWYRLEYAGLKEVVAVVRSDSSVVRYAYDRELDLVRVVNEEGDVHTIERDLEGRILGERTFDGRSIRFEHDAGGRVVKMEFDGDESVELVYDDMDRVVLRTFSDDTVHKVSYDERGRIVQFETDAVRTQYTYDARGRCKQEETEILGDPAARTKLVHFYAGGMQRTGTEVRGEWGVAARRDPVGRCAAVSVTSRKGAPEPLAAFAYDGMGGETSRAFGGGGGLSQTRDAHGNVLRASVLGRGTSPVRAGEPIWVGREGAPENLQFDHRWSAAGELVEIADRDRGAQRFVYDARGRIMQKQHSKRAKSEDYDLSARGDVRSIAGRAQSHDAGGRLRTTEGATLEYDARGRVIRRKDAQGETAYSWAVSGLLSGMVLPDETRVDYLYDGFARRLEKRVTGGGEVVRHRYVWDGQDLLEETVERRALDAAPDVAFAMVARRRYAYAPHSCKPVAQIVETGSGGGAWQHLVYRDGAPVPLALASGDGTPLAVFENEAYGAVISGDPTATLARFPGHWFDAESGLHYNRFRYFDPKSATYLSPEPLGLLGSLESYGYVNGRPTAWFDRDGLARSTTSITDTNGNEIATGTSSSNPDLHPAVAAALPVVSARGGDTDAASCSEPAALSQHLRNWENANPPARCDPGTPEGRQNLSKALSQVGGIGSKAGKTPLAACPNCSQTISRLFAMADPPVPMPTVAPGQVSTRDPTIVPNGLQNPEGPRTLPPNPNTGRPEVNLPPSPLAADPDNPANRAANQGRYEAAGGTGDVSGLNPGVFDNSTGAWGPRP